jgi:acetate kinase
LKFELLEMEMWEEEILAKGVIERIGLNDSAITMNTTIERGKELTKIANHKEAVIILLAKLISWEIISSHDEIEGIGHRVLHGGEKLSESVLITEEILKEIEEASEHDPFYNPASLIGIRVFLEIFPDVPSLAVFVNASSRGHKINI